MKKYGREQKQLKNFGYSGIRKKRKKKKKDHVPGYLYSAPIRIVIDDSKKEVKVRITKSGRIRKARWQTYQDYLKSRTWKRMRDRKLKRDNYKCFKCKGKATEVHHLRYVKWGKEKNEDLASACRSCHKIIHNKN